MVKHNKLVRDLIPAIIQEHGEVAVTRVLGDDEYLKALLDKLGEEYQEFQEHISLEELADITEVVYALADVIGSRQELEKVRLQKLTDRGGFTDRIFLERTE